MKPVDLTFRRLSAFFYVASALLIVGSWHALAEDGPAAKEPPSTKKPDSQVLPSENPNSDKAQKPARPTENDGTGVVIDGFYPATIIEHKDGSLLTEKGLRSTDRGRTWSKSPTFKAPVEIGNVGIMRLPNGELGLFEDRDDDMPEALGNANNNWFFRWSSDEGQHWSDPVQITLNGLTLGLQGTMFPLRDGKRIAVVTYSQFLGSGFDKRGASSGTLNGQRIKTETEAHYPQAEACRMYYSDDNGRTWKANDGWIMGWRDNRITDAITEGDAVELKDGRLMLFARAMTGRVHVAFSEDRGHSWWPGAKPIELASSYSPIRIKRLPKTNDLLLVWNQVSREEIRKGLRRSRLSCAISKDEGKTWEHFKNIEAIRSLAGVSRVPVDKELDPIWGDDEVGELPSDYANFHYPNISIVGDEVFISYFAGPPSGQGHRTRILPVEWFYR